MASTLYTYADLGRAGLGNMMITWGRCEIFRHRANLPMLAPRWVRAKLGPIIRRERDTRFYFDLFRNEGYITGLRRLYVLARANQLAEADVSAADPEAPLPANHGLSLIVFRGIDRLFEPLLGHHALLAGRLQQILSPRIKRRLADASEPFTIGVHIRRGDKPALAFGEPQLEPNRSLPLEWFARAVHRVREQLGFAAPVRLFSEAAPAVLGPLLSLDNVTLAPPSPSIVDILLLARSRVLITSAHSTFSMWASYLGQMPTIWYPGGQTLLDRDRPELQIETDLVGNLPDDCGRLFQQAVQAEGTIAPASPACVPSSSAAAE